MTDALITELEAIATSQRRRGESHADALLRLEASGSNSRFNELITRIRDRRAASAP